MSMKNSSDTIGNRTRNLGILDEANFFSSGCELGIRDDTCGAHIRDISFS
jgi:hypothetical protein